ncbi:hypothetical protein AK812_SmicGene10977 [Symbiodinium microadriaticum]|uniref:Uncharacterized protein n=1 Tax=Symbiodinium microadriaticum TaxID=2951 RepID=A0A1Q9EED4_SYMMI|nr:hypothetical protein AK812_SmicGene10977 [Symbiodinium microadriaticum]
MTATAAKSIPTNRIVRSEKRPLLTKFTTEQGAARKKTESGKWHKKKTRHYWVATFPAKFTLRLLNDNARTVTRLLLHFSPGASGKQKLLSKRVMCRWLKASQLRFVESSDRVAWSESQIHECLDLMHSMLEGTNGLQVGTWQQIFKRMVIGAGDDKIAPLRDKESSQSCRPQVA